MINSADKILMSAIQRQPKQSQQKVKKLKLDFETISILQDLLLGSHCCFDLSGGLQGW